MTNDEIPNDEGNDEVRVLTRPAGGRDAASLRVDGFFIRSTFVNECFGAFEIPAIVVKTHLAI